MSDDALFPAPAVSTPASGAVERALNEAAEHDPFASKYPAAVELARLLARNLDRAEHQRNAASGVASLGKVYLMALAPLGLAPALESHPGDPMGDGKEGTDGDPFSGYSGPTLVDPKTA